jgi:hypothetical protein
MRRAVGLQRITDRVERDGEYRPGLALTYLNRPIAHVWIAGWTSVHKAMADLVEELLKGKGDTVIVDVARHRAADFVE